jgi:DNA-directed RNA polymerase specialized sigma24 family protein
MVKDYWEAAISEIRQNGPGCAAAFDFIYGNLVRTAMAVSGDTEAARDVASQCVCGLLESRDSHAAAPSGKSLKRRARYLAQAFLEGQRDRTLAESNFIDRMRVCSGNTDAAELSDLRQQITRMAALLEPAHEKVAILYLVGGCSLDQMSVILGKTLEKTRSELVHAVHWLRKLSVGPRPDDLAYLRHRRRISDVSGTPPV